MSLILGIDTSNYATSLAVYDSDSNSFSAMKKRFLPVKEGQLGLRQSDAVFHHTVAVREMLEELSGDVKLSDISAVGVSVKPRPVEGSYMPCFLVGQTVAKSFALARNIPVIETTHQQGHIASALFADGCRYLNDRLFMFHVSGGTTDLLLVDKLDVVKTLGTSSDLYAGQAVDRLGVRLGFGFPAGADVSKMAAQCGEKINPPVSVKGMDCSFSGLQNQCEKLLNDGKAPEYACRYCLNAVGKTLTKMLSTARNEIEDLPCVFAGGVMSSDIIRDYVTARMDRVSFVPGLFSSDSAAGPAVIATIRTGAYHG